MGCCILYQVKLFKCQCFHFNYQVQCNYEALRLQKHHIDQAISVRKQQILGQLWVLANGIASVAINLAITVGLHVHFLIFCNYSPLV